MKILSFLYNSIVVQSLNLYTRLNGKYNSYIIKDNKSDTKEKNEPNIHWWQMIIFALG